MVVVGWTWQAVECIFTADTKTDASFLRVSDCPNSRRKHVVFEEN